MIDTTRNVFKNETDTINMYVVGLVLAVPTFLADDGAY